MKRQIIFYHGPSEILAQKLIEAGAKVAVEDGSLSYDGSLDHLAANYPHHFIVSEEYIAVTQYSSWGAR